MASFKHIGLGIIQHVDTPSSTGTPSATQDPLTDTESDDDVSLSVAATKK